MNSSSKNYVKLCLVCGDKASAFNFRGLSCESCKIFFRRNAQRSKKLQCSVGGKCEINIGSRRCCRACRLEKCHSIGMKLVHKSANKVPLIEEKCLVDFEYNSTYCLEAQQGDNPQCLPENAILPFPTVPFKLYSYEWSHIEEIQSAIAIFENESALPVVGVTETIVDAFNLPSNYARRIVKFCKNISCFKQLNRADQLLILKPFYFEICVIRFAFYYEVQHDGVRMISNETGQHVLLYSFKIFDNIFRGEIGEFHRKLLQRLHFEMENDPIIRDLLIAQFLFKSREKVTCPEFLKYRYYVYRRLLGRYFEFKYRSHSKAEHKYVSLMDFLGDSMANLREILSQLLCGLNANMVAQVQRDIFS